MKRTISTIFAIIFFLSILSFGCAKDFPANIILKKSGKGKGACFGVIGGISTTNRDAVAVFLSPDGKAKYKIKIGDGGIFVLNRKPGTYKLLSYKYVDKSGTTEVTLKEPLPFDIEVAKIKYIGRIFSSPVSKDVYLIDEFVRDSFLFMEHFGENLEFVSSFPNEKYYGLMKAAAGKLKTNSPRSPYAMVKFESSVFLLGDVRPGAEVLLDDYSNISEIPPHQVQLDGFSMDRDPVSNQQYANFSRTAGIRLPSSCNKGKPRFTGNYVTPGWENKPATCISRDMAQAYCESKNGRLPTEAEWELAARGKPWGNRNYGGNQDDFIPGEKSGNRLIGGPGWWISPYGVAFDGGTIAEWVFDRYSPRYYQDSPSNNPSGPKTGQSFIARSGPYRFSVLKEYRSTKIGFRCVKSDANMSLTTDTPSNNVITVSPDLSNTFGSLPRLIVKKKSRIYLKPTIAAQIVAEIKPGVILGNLGREAGWYKVKMSDGRIGYIFEDFARPLE